MTIQRISAVVLLVGCANGLLLNTVPTQRVANRQILMQVGTPSPGAARIRNRIQPAPLAWQTDDVPGDVEEMAAATTVDAPAFEADDKSEGAIAKQALMAEMSGGLGGPKPDKAAIGEILLALEAQNPTPSPATSALLNGKWKVLYATGASPGLKALTLLLKGVKQAPKSPSGAELIDVQDTFVTIQAEQPRVEAATAVRVLSFENTAKLLCRLEPESAVRLLETYDAYESEGSLSLPKLPFSSGPLQYKRSILATYLDEEVLVLRDAAGRPDVLMRCDEVAPAEPAEPAAPAAEEEAAPAVEVVDAEEETDANDDAPSD
jgi:hypothetical protein